MSLSVSAGTGNRVSGTLMPLATRNFEPAAAARSTRTRRTSGPTATISPPIRPSSK